MVMHADSCFLQMFLWEKVPSIVPKPIEFSAIVMKKMIPSDGSKGMRLRTHTSLELGDGLMANKMQINPLLR